MTKTASKLFSMVYPAKNYYAASPKKQRAFKKAAAEFEQYLSTQKKDTN